MSLFHLDLVTVNSDSYFYQYESYLKLFLIHFVIMLFSNRSNFFFLLCTVFTAFIVSKQRKIYAQFARCDSQWVVDNTVALDDTVGQDSRPSERWKCYNCVMEEDYSHASRTVRLYICIAVL